MNLHNLKIALQRLPADSYEHLIEQFDEITLECSVAQYRPLLIALRDALGFEQLIDLCGVDYSTYQNQQRSEKRFAVVVHLLSVSQNYRVRVRVFTEDTDPAVVPTVCDLYASSNWYEREAFDLMGIVFAEHPDLRRILTDYNFVGHPLRKDFPTSGYMEMCYDEQEGRVVYQPVSIEPREITPRIVREENYGG